MFNFRQESTVITNRVVYTNFYDSSVTRVSVIGRCKVRNNKAIIVKLKHMTISSVEHLSIQLYKEEEIENESKDC